MIIFIRKVVIYLSRILLTKICYLEMKASSNMPFFEVYSIKYIYNSFIDHITLKIFML